MGTEVLRPQDCLIQRIRIAPAVFHRRKNYGNPKPNPNNYYRKPVVPVVRHDQRRRSPEPPVSKRSASSEDFRPRTNPNNLVLGQVTILRRGESVDSKMKSDLVPLKKNGDDLMVCGTGRIGPDPDMVPKQIRLSPGSGTCRSDVYAGSAFSLSPSPSSLPLPSFFSKNLKSVDDSATRDLRRLLRLD